jgi:F0F1-type ATP synthase membrane subunit a
MMHLILAVEDPLNDVLPHNFFSFLGLHVNNQMIMAAVAAILMLLIFPRLFPRPDSSAPTGAKNFFESILEFLRVEVFRPALKEHTDQFLPFLWTLFFFILFCNVLSCIPFAAFFELISGGRIQHLGGAATGGISTTAALAICAFFFIHGHGLDQIARQLMNGTFGHHEHDPRSHSAHDQEHMRGEALATDLPGDFRALGDPGGHYSDAEHKPPPAVHEAAALRAVSANETMTPLKALLLSVPLYLWNFAPHPFRPTEPGAGWTKWVPDIAMWLVLLLLELLGGLIKPLALCLRLFANMVAGHVLLAVLIGLIVVVPGLALRLAIGLPISLLDLGIQLLELFVAFLQAYIFVFLTTLFIASAVAPEH